jgi:tagatose-6-phosphate ketose/aldose isomerase
MTESLDADVLFRYEMAWTLTKFYEPLYESGIGVRMSQSLSESSTGSFPATPSYTLQEILQQPDLWPNTVERVRAASDRLHLSELLQDARVVLTGAGTSFYAASAIAAAWPRSVAIPTTELLIDAERYLIDVGALIFLTRSGNSPETAALVEHVRARQPNILQLVIVCDSNGTVGRSPIDGLIDLDPLTNGRGFVPTIAFSNLVLAGLALAQPNSIGASVDELSARAFALLPEIDSVCRYAAARAGERIVVLSSSPLLGWAADAGLLALEMTDCRFQVLIDTFLGLRHGLMSFLKPGTLVLGLTSSDPVRRLYERDLLDELRAKKVGYLVGISDPTGSELLFDDVIPAVAPRMDDALRTPYEMIGPQLLSYYLGRHLRLNPDDPCSVAGGTQGGQQFRIHPANSSAHGATARLPGSE